MVKKADVYVEEFMVMYKEILTQKERIGPLITKNAFVDTAMFICNRLIAEVKEIAEMRHAKSDLAFTAIIKEQDRKWKAIARRLNDKKLPFNAHPDAFQIVWNQFHSNMMKHD